MQSWLGDSTAGSTCTAQVITVDQLLQQLMALLILISVISYVCVTMSLFFTENSRASYFQTPAPYFDRKLWSYSLLLPISLQPSNKTKCLRNPLLVWGCDYPLIDFIIKFVSEEGLVNIRLMWSNMTDA